MMGHTVAAPLKGVAAPLLRPSGRGHHPPDGGRLMGVAAPLLRLSPPGPHHAHHLPLRTSTHDTTNTVSTLTSAYANADAVVNDTAVASQNQCRKARRRRKRKEADANASKSSRLPTPTLTPTNPTTMTTAPTTAT